MFEFTHMEEGGSVAFCHRGFSHFYDVYMQLGEHARRVGDKRRKTEKRPDNKK